MPFFHGRTGFVRFAVEIRNPEPFGEETIEKLTKNLSLAEIAGQRDACAGEPLNPDGANCPEDDQNARHAEHG